MAIEGYRICMIFNTQRGLTYMATSMSMGEKSEILQKYASNRNGLPLKFSTPLSKVYVVPLI
jgi:hypothetical protein